MQWRALGAVVVGAACLTSARAQPPAPVAAAPPSAACPADPLHPAPLPVAWSERRRLVFTVVCEWARFGFATVEVERATAAQERSLSPALGLPPRLRRLPDRANYADSRRAVGVQTRDGVTEDDTAVSSAIEAYWVATDPGFVERVRAMRQVVEQRYGSLHQDLRVELYPGWWRAWSAAFVTWSMQRARAGWFRGSEWHSLYLAWSTADRPERLVRIDRYRPMVGDLICFGRTGVTGERGMPDAQSFIDRVRAIRRQEDAFPAHCDVILRVNRTSVVSIGGNVRNSVAATVTPLRRGRLMRSNVRPWSAALKLDGPADPCARIETTPTGPWSSEAAEAARRRSLRGLSC